MAIELLKGEGFPGDPINSRITAINAALTEAQTLIDRIKSAQLKYGVATLEDGNTTVVVAHGLGYQGSPGCVVVTPIEAWGAATQLWVHTHTTDGFTIEADQDPGQDVDIAWHFQKTDF